MPALLLLAVLAGAPGAAPRLLYGGYSMQPGDWRKIAGVFNLVHHCLLSMPGDKAAEILDAAAAHGLQVLVRINEVYDAEEHRLDVARLSAFARRFASHPALHGYLLEAAYKIPPGDQLRVFDAVKSVDGAHAFWMEFSSTDVATWRTRFNQNACDVLLSYNYPYEAADKSDMTARIDYSVRAIEAVVTRDIPVVPLLQAFGGGRWRAPKRGDIWRQYARWRRCAKVIGVGFYRWRGRKPYTGLAAPGMEQCTEEAFALCRMIARLERPFQLLPFTGPAPILSPE